jgi:hypothetical protein
VIELSDSGPNDQVVADLLARLEWFFNDFLARHEMTRERDGKVVGDLVVKALQKVIAQSTKFRHVDLVSKYDALRRSRSRQRR